eukprot:CAMPEP_0169485530 /NCGR_PEP_ID=MMETSP1042-20121227/32338_1 /TAXON_ID=464988 /ORGANISM="Hemiselmis andersenii, Strain CCMP1180" /LENGTH=144 /DNA_ID=CAMNT_0009600631 /DNA_START=37 /DNA_END=471 /DNA_ORIENTATION=+
MQIRTMLVLSSALCACAFTPPSTLPLSPARLPAISARPLRCPLTTTKASFDLPTPIYTIATNILLADVGFDSAGSKTDRLYNGIPATGNVEAPAWVPFAIGFGIAVVLTAAIPLLLKPGTDAFNEQRNNIGVWTDKGTKEDQFK